VSGSVHRAQRLRAHASWGISYAPRWRGFDRILPVICRVRRSRAAAAVDDVFDAHRRRELGCPQSNDVAVSRRHHLEGPRNIAPMSPSLSGPQRMFALGPAFPLLGHHRRRNGWFHAAAAPQVAGSIPRTPSLEPCSRESDPGRLLAADSAHKRRASKGSDARAVWGQRNRDLRSRSVRARYAVTRTLPNDVRCRVERHVAVADGRLSCRIDAADRAGSSFAFPAASPAPICFQNCPLLEMVCGCPVPFNCCGRLGSRRTPFAPVDTPANRPCCPT